MGDALTSRGSWRPHSDAGPARNAKQNWPNFAAAIINDFAIHKEHQTVLLDEQGPPDPLSDVARSCRQTVDSGHEASTQETPRRVRFVGAVLWPESTGDLAFGLASRSNRDCEIRGSLDVEPEDDQKTCNRG
jgi:hypothetical protein